MAAKLLQRARLLFGIDLRSLALFRIVAGTLLLFDLADRARLLGANYTDAGAHPRAEALAYFEPGLLPSLHLMAGSARVQIALFVLAAGAAALLAVGWRTRLATFVSWFLLDSLHARNGLILDGGDHLLRHLLFWSLFLPLGALWSFDARRQGPATRQRVCSPASAALLLQVASVFLVTGLVKSGPEWTTDDTAIRYALDRRWWILPFGKWLLAQPLLPELLTPAVRWWEILGPLLLFVPVAIVPLRLLGIAGFWGLLAGLGLGLKLNLFPYITGAGLLPFLPAAVWDWLGRRFALLRAGAPAAPLPATGWRRLAAGVVQAGVLGLLLLLLGWVNVGSVNPSLAPPPPLARVASRLHLEQGWMMYAPSPRHIDVWFEHRGRLANGSMVNLDRAAGGAGWAQVERAWHDYRFMYYLQKLAIPRWQGSLSAYAGWLCRQWNQDREGGARLEHISVSPMIEPIAIRDEPQQPATAEPATTVLCPR